ncbi:MAG TPA: hypothetical protein VMS88_07255 [Terriglobales bacterium]|nr:hypothetical protein [Terriglobales bacterium]
MNARPRASGWLLVLAAMAVFALHAGYYWHWTEDDAFISFRYARNLAAGQGLVFNPGQRVEGYSNPSWVLLAAAVLRVGGDPERASKIAGLAAGAVAVLLSWLLARRIAPRASGTALFAPWAVALSPVLARNAVNGLESGFFALLLTAGVLLAFAEESAWRRVLLVADLALLSVTRPEGPLFAALILALRVVLGSRPGGVGRRSAAADLVGWLVLYGAYFIWHLSYFGGPFPNTYYAKMTGGLPALANGIRYSVDFARDGGGVLFVAIALAPVALGVAGAPLGLTLVVIAAYVAFVCVSGGDWMADYRFYAHVLPLVAASIAAGIAALLALPRPGRERAVAYVALALVLIATLASMAATEAEVAREVMPAVRAHCSLSQNYERLGRWLRQNTAPEAVIAVSDVGAVAYFSERPILDMFGLIDPHIAHLPGRLHFKADPGYVLARRPDWVVLVSRDDGGAGRSFLRIPDARLFAEPAFQRDYERVAAVPQHWQNEFVLIYRRRS